MRSERLFRILGLVDGALVLEAGEAAAPAARRKRRWSIPMAAAACGALVCGLALARWGLGNINMGGGANAGGSGHDGGTVFMSYGGPVFPLGVLEEDVDLTAERAVIWDLAPGAYRDGEPRQWGAAVTDGYILSNSTGEDITVNALYPFTGSLQNLAERMPAVTVDGTEAEPILYAGPYSGGFQSASPDGSDTLNLAYPDSWEDYKALLSDGRYREQALGDYPVLDVPVTVYQFTDFAAPHEEYRAATQAVTLSADESETTVFTYGFNGYEGDPEEGWARHSYFVPDGVRAEPELKLLIVLGKDLEDYVLQGYQDGGCSRGEEIEGVSCTVIRRESTLDEVLDEICRYDSERYGALQGEEADTGAAFALFRRAVGELLADMGPLPGNRCPDRYSYGFLDDLVSEARAMDRVLYLQFPVTVPAGGDVSVSASLWKAPSHDFDCSGSENVGIQGYDMVTALGSSLRFTRQTAALVNGEGVEIVRQNFGFDLAGGVSQVELDMGQEHYYLEIRVREED